jgi:BirA family transcriptional regulator, biotin operon repressor / biotin---[acetyl-CoA-carboxylase] ligase
MFTGMTEGGARSGAGDSGGPEAAGPAGSSSAAGEEARARLQGSRFADVRWVAGTGSTNADAMALARDGAPEGIVVVADHQSAGRGRRTRSWVSPPGGSLLVSVLLRPPAPVAGAVTMAAAVAMVDAVQDVAGVTAGVKWPNDLVVATAAGDRKLAGILAEADWPAGSTASGGFRAPAPHERAVVVVGVGLNVTWPSPSAVSSDATLAEVADVATALNWVGPEVDRVDVLVAFLHRLDGLYTALVRTGPADLVDEWRGRSATLGRRVRVDLGPEDVEGRAVDVTGEGQLVIDTVEGGRRTVAAGDVVHLRPL